MIRKWSRPKAAPPPTSQSFPRKRSIAASAASTITVQTSTIAVRSRFTLTVRIRATTAALTLRRKAPGMNGAGVECGPMKAVME